MTIGISYGLRLLILLKKMDKNSGTAFGANSEKAEETPGDKLR